LAGFGFAAWLALTDSVSDAVAHGRLQNRRFSKIDRARAGGR